MPVGTKGTIKGLTSREMEHLNCKILLGNTYHLALQVSKKVRTRKRRRERRRK
jgi:queuine tRNA-ribosyltransferase